MRYTPYIYILFFLNFVLPAFSQANKVLTIRGSEKHMDALIQHIGYQTNLANDSIYLEEIKLFRSKLDQLGFIGHKITEISKNDSLYLLTINLRNAIDMVSIKHPEISVISKDLNYKISNNKTQLDIPFTAFSLFMNRLAIHYQNSGFPFVSLKLKNIENTANSLTADLIIKKGEKRTIDKIEVMGYTAFPKSYIDRKFSIRLGHLYSKEKIERISVISKTIPFVSEIKPPEILFTKDSTALFLYLKKEKSNYFDGLLGFGNSQSEKALQVYGTIDLKLNNVFNSGESVELKWLSSQDNSKSLDASIRTPYIFNTALSVAYTFAIHKQDTTYSSVSHLLATDYSISTNQQVGFLLENLRSNKTSTMDLSNINDFNSFFYGTSYSYSVANNHSYFNTKLYLKSQVSQGKRNGLKQYKIANTFKHLIPINNKNNLVLKNTTEMLFSKKYIDNELFRLGGSKSIRGFDEQSLLTDKFSFFNIEYNYLIDQNTFISVLSDVGFLNLTHKNSLINLYSFGVGFSQKMRIGQLGVHYFIGNTNISPFSFNQSKLHFTISQNF